MKNITAIFMALILLALPLAGCGAQEAPEGEGLSVVATVFAPYDFARQLVGERGEVTLLLPPGSEAHSYEPTPKDIIDIQNCDLFIYVGGISDAWVADVLDSVGEGVRTVTLMDCVELLEEEHVEGMELEEEHGHDEGEAEYDEHVWTSPRNAALICEKIAAALAEADPEGAEYYEAALGDYTASLDELDAAFKEVVANGARAGCADEAEPSAATVTFLIDKVKEEGIPVVFHIELSNEDMADIVCDETGAEKRLFSACHNVTRAQFEEGVTYLELMRQNVDVLREALG